MKVDWGILWEGILGIESGKKEKKKGNLEWREWEIEIEMEMEMEGEICVSEIERVRKRGLKAKKKGELWGRKERRRERKERKKGKKTKEN